MGSPRLVDVQKSLVIDYNIKMSKFTLVVSLILVVLKSFGDAKFVLDAYPKINNLTPSNDTGVPLFLTPLITAGKIVEAQNMALVSNFRFKGVKSYSGFFTVNEAFKSNQFFWFIRSSNPSKDTPVILWLQGGPGASSLFGLFFENGPFIFKGKHLKSRWFSWHKVAHMIYIDNPVGTGFSFTSGGYAQNETAVGNDLYNSLSQFFQLFPDLKDNPFYVTGESYAGKYVPAVCHTIKTKNENAKQKINLQGFAIGNGLCDPINQLKYSDLLYQLGLIDVNGFKLIQSYEEKAVDFIKKKQWKEAADVFDVLINADHFPYGSVFYNLTGYKSYYNYLETHDTTNESSFEKLLQNPVTRKAIHVGNTPFSDGAAVQENLYLDMMQSVAGWVSDLLSHYRGIIYNGQLDIIIGYTLTENFLKNLNFSAANEYKNATRHQWIVDKEIAGYVKTAGNLTEVVVRDAGHMVPANQPKWALDMITRFVMNKPFY